MAKSHPELPFRSDLSAVASMEPWARRALAGSLLLLLLLISLVILHNQFGIRLAAGVMDAVGAVDLVNLVPHKVEPPEAAAVVDVNARKYQAIGEYLARRYRVSTEVATDIVVQSYRSAAQFHLDPMLILAVISVESRFNPIAESSMGAKGLMQVIPRFHSDKFNQLGGEKVAFEPGANIWVGASILKDCLRRTRDLVDALQMYVGASSEENENGYSAKVMDERDRLYQVLRQHQLQMRHSAHPPPRPVKEAI